MAAASTVVGFEHVEPRGMHVSGKGMVKLPRTGNERSTPEMQGTQGTVCLVRSMSGAARVPAANIVATTVAMILKDICEEEGVVTYLKNSPMTILTHLM